MTRHVILYELNEVPWSVIDEYVARRPHSCLAGVLDRSVQATTVDDDAAELMPWRTWPTFHGSVYTADHRSYDQGQDPDTFRGVPLWDVVEAAGMPVGLFGLLQSWPPRHFAHGGFWVPDCFASDATTFPYDVEPFQRFSLDMTSQNLFAPSERAPLAASLRVAPELLALGVRPKSLRFAAAQLAHERRDTRYRERRSVVQALPSFDVYWSLHKRTRPALSVFFTNHVAALMHRFLRDLLPDGPGEHTPEPLHGEFLLTALDVFDDHLRRIVRWMRRTPDSALVVASSMGQGPLPDHDMAATYVLDDHGAFARALALPACDRERCMYPRITLRFAGRADVGIAVERVEAVSTGDGPLFRDLRPEGRTLSFEISYRHDVDRLPTVADWHTGDSLVLGAPIAELGVSVRGRSFGGDSGGHTPEGMFLVHGEGITPDPSRTTTSVLDAAPSILAMLGLPADPSMRGRPSLAPVTVGS